MGIHNNTLNNTKLVNNNTALILIIEGAGKLKKLFLLSLPIYLVLLMLL